MQEVKAYAPPMPPTMPAPAPIASDGGSSTYYDIKLPQWLLRKLDDREGCVGGVYIKTEELIEVLGSDFDEANILKCLIRAVGARKGGGKMGNSLRYECNKIKYSTDRLLERAERYKEPI